MTVKTAQERRAAVLQDAVSYAQPAIAAAQAAIRAALNQVPPAELARHVAALTPAARANRDALAEASRRLASAAHALAGHGTARAEAELIQARRFGTY